MITPLHDWILVKLDPLPEDKIGSIFVLGSALPRVRTATVVRVGPGRRNKESGEREPHFLEPGMKVLFFREHLEHKTGRQVTAALNELEDGHALLRSYDFLGVEFP